MITVVKLLGPNVLKAITFSAKLATSVATLATILVGCPHAEKEWAKFELLKTEYENDYDKITNISQLSKKIRTRNDI